MKTLKGMLGKPIGIHPDKEEANRALPTFREMLKDCVSLGMSEPSKSALESFQLGLKLMQEQEEIKLEDAELRLLKDAVLKNAPRFVDHYKGQLELKIKEAEEDK